MPRVENVINVIGKKKQSAVVAVPPGAEKVQVVLERSLFEDTTTDSDVCRIGVHMGKDKGPGVVIGGGASKSRRPGNRKLWDYGYWGLPRGIKEITVVMEPYQYFNCCIHVDFF